MNWSEHEQTIRARHGLGAKQPSEASKAVDTLLGLGWTSENFADVAAGLRKKEQRASGAGPLRKVINKGK
jgi:hypothetical protein